MKTGRADQISITYFALFIQEQLEKEVETMMEDGSRRGRGQAHARTHTHTQVMGTYSVSKFESPAKQLSPISLILLLWRCLEKRKHFVRGG